jgi:hypothetical protein
MVPRFLEQTVPSIALGAVVHQGLDDLPAALGTMFVGLDLAPSQRVLPEVAVDVVDEGAHLPQRLGDVRRMLGGLQPPMAGVEDERVQLPVFGGDGVVLLLVLQLKGPGSRFLQI